MNDLYTKWELMWSAHEWGTQGFFIASFIVALMIMAGPLRSKNEDRKTKKIFTFSVGFIYFILVAVGYLQLTPKISAY